MLPAQREFFQFITILVIDFLTPGPPSSTNFVQRRETMSGPEFCVGIRAQLMDEIMSDKTNGRNGRDLLLLAFNFTTNPAAVGEFFELTHKFMTVVQIGVFSSDFVTAQHAYKIPSNRTAKMTNQEFCDRVRTSMRLALEDAVLNGAMDNVENLTEILNEPQFSDESCDDIVMELNGFKSSPIWNHINNMIEEINLRVSPGNPDWEIRLMDEVRRLGILTTCLLDGLKWALQG